MSFSNYLFQRIHFGNSVCQDTIILPYITKMYSFKRREIVQYSQFSQRHHAIIINIKNTMNEKYYLHSVHNTQTNKSPENRHSTFNVDMHGAHQNLTFCFRMKRYMQRCREILYSSCVSISHGAKPLHYNALQKSKLKNSQNSFLLRYQIILIISLYYTQSLKHENFKRIYNKTHDRINNIPIIYFTG